MNPSQLFPLTLPALPSSFFRTSKRFFLHLQILLLGILTALAGYTANDSEQFRASTIVHQEKSLYRNILVAEGDGYRCLKFGRIHARQTCIEIANPARMVLNYTQALLTGLYVTDTPPRRVLVLGLGGGVIPRALRSLDGGIEIDAVELDPAVVRVAQSHFGHREDARLRSHVDDARVFVRKQRRLDTRYDLIIVDAFDKDYIPEHLLTREFLEELKTLLNPGGAVAANTFAEGALTRYEAATYQAVFGEIFNLDTDNGNRIILARRGQLPTPAFMRDRAASLAAGFSSVGASAADLLSRIRPVPKATDVRVLTDQFSPANLLLQQTQ